MEAPLSSRIESRPSRCWPGPGWSQARAVEALEQALRAVESGARARKHIGRKRQYRLELSGGAGTCLLKICDYERRGLRGVRTSKALRELQVAAELARRGVSTPKPIAAGEIREGLRLRRCFLLVPLVAGACDLREVWNHGDRTAREHGRIATGLGRHVRQLHEAGLDQADLAPNNVLVTPGNPVGWLPIDFERACLPRRLGTATRARNLAVLDRHLTGATAAERMRFLLAYTQGDRARARDWWRRLEVEAARAATQDHTRLRRRIIRDGRRVVCVDWQPWQGWTARSASAQVRELLDDPDAGFAAAESRSLRFTRAHGVWLGAGRGTAAWARRLWVNAHLLALRGLGPEPLALLRQSDGAVRFVAERATGDRTQAESTDPAARRAAAVLVDRLRAIGRLEPLPQEYAIAIRRPAAGARAVLIDPGALRIGSPGPWPGWLRAR